MYNIIENYNNVAYYVGGKNCGSDKVIMRY